MRVHFSKLRVRSEMLSLLLKPRLLAFPSHLTATKSMSASAGARGLTQRMFQLKIDPLTGMSEWVVIEGEEEDNGNHKTPEGLLAATSYLDMLNDTRRNNAFRLAIEKTITRPCHVLDIGAGTGLLSLMAARTMDLSDLQGGVVTACESYLPMVKLMRKILRANHMDGKIRIINKRSDELEVGFDIPTRAEVLVSEILDSELLGEGLIPTLQHAHDKLLIENLQTVPYCATNYGQLVECKHFREMHDLVNRDAEASDDIQLVPSGMSHLIGIKQQQYALHCDAIQEEVKLLSAPFKVFDFDFWRRPESSRETELHIKVTSDGTVHAIISWWLLQLDAEGTIFYSTKPRWVQCLSDSNEVKSSFHGSGQWCDHWKQTVWFAPHLGLSVFKDEQVKVHAAHTETSISFEFENSPCRTDVVDHDLSLRGSQIVLSPERNALYGNHGWRCLILNAVKKALHKRANPLCLVADDSIFLAISIAHLSKSSNVIAFFPGLGNKGLQYLQKVAAANNYTVDRIEILKQKDLSSALQDGHLRKINLLVAEPFYSGNDSVLPWQNFRFWKQRTMLGDLLSEDVLVMPCRGSLKACAMYIPDLWRSRCCLKEVEGFDHSMVNTVLGACGGLSSAEDTPFLSYFVWQCGETKILSETATLMEFDFSKPMSPCSGKTHFRFIESGACHGFVLWIDWVMDVEDTIVVSTGPDQRYWKQGVKLLTEPVDIRDVDLYSTEIEAAFDPSNGELIMHHNFHVNKSEEQ